MKKCDAPALMFVSNAMTAIHLIMTLVIKNILGATS